MTVVAVAGNPNCGKTTLFNRLTGLRQKVGNYPGVTIERRTGVLQLAEKRATLVDLPGTYSLVPRSQDESIAFRAMTGRGGEPAPELIVVVVDATNLERNLYLTLSIIELGYPTIVAVNMMDEAEAHGIAPDLDVLGDRLGVPAVGISAKFGRGLDVLRKTISTALADPFHPPARQWRLDSDGETTIAKAREAAAPDGGTTAEGAAVWALAAWASQQPDSRDGDPLRGEPELRHAVEAATAGVQDRSAFAAQLIEARYAIAREIATQARPKKTAASARDFTDHVDRYVLHPVIGGLIFLAIMAVVFQAIFAGAEPLMGGIEAAVSEVQSMVAAGLPEGALRDLLVHGVIGGVGNVIVFVPQIAILFAFIALLEDSGYLSRAAFLSDRLMAKAGLHGRAFVPLLSGFACAVPAILATRAIETRRDRLVTILVAPLVSCSARLPVYTLIIAALFASDERIAGVFTVGGLLMLAMYGLSLLFTISIAFILKRTLLASPIPPLVLELPPYRRPELTNVIRRAYERCGVFIRDAGTVILACSIVLWALLYFPRDVELPFDPVKQAINLQTAHRASITRVRDPEKIKEMGERLERAMASLESRIQAARVHNSFAGRLGRTIEPVIEPLGYDWKIGIGLLASFAAREVFVSTMGLVYGVGEDVDETSVPLRDKFRAQRHLKTRQPVYTPLVGLSLMMFFALALQCMSTVAAIRRETNSWRWAAFAVVYTGTLAWLAAFIVYQGGRLLGYT